MYINKKFFIISIIIVLNIPIIIILLGYRVLFSNEYHKKKSLIEDQVFLILNRLESIAKDPETHFSQIFSNIELKTSKYIKPDTIINIWKNELYKLKNSFPQKYKANFEFLIFDYEKETVAVKETTKVIPNKLMKKFFKAYRNFIYNHVPLNATEEAFLKSFFGNLLTPNERIDQKLIYSSSYPTNEYIYISSPTKQIIICAFIKVKTILQDLALTRELKSILSKNKSLKITVLSSDKSISKAINKYNIPPHIHQLIIKELDSNFYKKLWINNLFITLRVVIPNRYLFAILDAQNTVNNKTEDIYKYFLLTSSILTLSPFVIDLLFPNWLYYLIKLKFIIPFSIVYTSIIPLILLWYASYLYIQEKEENLINDKLQKIIRILDSFDRKFDFYLVRVKQKIYHHYVKRKYSYKNYDLSNQNDFKKLLFNLNKDYKFDICQIFDINGNIVEKYVNPKTRLNPNFLINTLSEISKFSIPAYKLETILSSYTKNSAPDQRLNDPLAKALLGKKITSFSFNELNVSQVEIFIASIPITDKKFKNFYIVYLIWERATVEKNYILEELTSIKGVSKDLRLAALNIISPSDTFPGIKNLNKLYNLASQFAGSEIGFKRIISSKIKDYRVLVGGIKGLFLSKYALIGWCTDIDIQREIRIIKNFVFLLGGSWLAIIIFASIILANQFVKPLLTVEKALHELEKRNFNYKLVIETQRQEFSKIADLFNQTFENLKDLEVARIVQETLFPKDVLRLNSFQIYGTCVPATQVGGDFFDYYILGTNKIIAILGDVSGHGTGSALVVAMVKAIRTHPNLCNNDNPIELLQSFHNVIFKILKRKKMMTCCIISIDTYYQKIEIANAGQCYPALVRNNQTELIEVSGLPLGSSKVWKCQTKSLSLLENDCLIMYSDGLIEALDINNQQIGYERLCKILPNLLVNDIVQSERNIRNWFTQMSPHKPPADDISILLIKYAQK